MSASVPVNLIRCDGGTQMRVAINEEAIESYADRMLVGDEFPPVVVFYDGKSYWLADGFHRVEARSRLAAKNLGRTGSEKWSSIDSDVRSGTRHDAIKFAIGANKDNGLRRTNADKQMAVRAALSHPDMRGMSDQQIADAVGVSKEMVRNAREVTTNVTSDIANNHKAVNTVTDRRIGTDGKSYPPRQIKSVKSAKSEIAQRIADRKFAAEKRDATRVVVGDGPPARVEQHICPTCNGKGFIE